MRHPRSAQPVSYRSLQMECCLDSLKGLYDNSAFVSRNKPMLGLWSAMRRR
jgi:hypothetical protein